jgi:tRNA (guanine-N7-)-methyltransferase
MRDPYEYDPSEVELTDAAALQRWTAGRALHVEVGFGKDVRILRAAARSPDECFLGIEISRKKAASFRRKVARTGLRNVRAYLGDVRYVLRELLRPESVRSFTILFPDPWPKRRHWKHRWIQEETAGLLAGALIADGTLTVATDHEGYRKQIRASLESAGLVLESESPTVPAEDETLFAERFRRLGKGVTYQRWRRRA